MKELFRFTSVRKFDTQKVPCNKINLDGLQGKYYLQALKAKSKKDIESISDAFFKSAFISDPLSVNVHITFIYQQMQERRAYTSQMIEHICKSTFGGNISAFIQDPQFNIAKSIIAENLFFLILTNPKQYSRIKVLYKHLLKIIGLLEAISNQLPCLEKILLNPSLQSVIFEFPTFNNEPGNKFKDKPDDSREGYKKELKKEYDYILDLKKTEAEMLSLHKKLIGELKKTNSKQLSNQKKPVGPKKNQVVTEPVTESEETNISRNTLLSSSFMANSKQLNDRSRKIFEMLNIDDSEFEPLDVINAIHNEVISRSNQLHIKLNPSRYITYQGKKTLIRNSSRFAQLDFLDGERDVFFAAVNSIGLDKDVPINSPDIPSGNGTAKVLGEGRLMRVEEDYLGCRLAHLSSVVNIPPYSKKEYKNRFLTKTVVLNESETSSSTTNETSSESREQNNMSSETEKTLSFDMSLQAGMNVSASYGPTVGVEASSDFSTSFSTSETSKSASSYAKDVTLRSVKKIEQRSRDFFRTERTTENEIINNEGYDNQNALPAVGIYQWINEVYKAKLVQYDSRLLLEFMIPEPGNLLLYAAGQPATQMNSPAPDPPIPFDITIDDINPDSYKEKAARWGAMDIVPPPPPSQTIAKAFNFLDTIENDKLANFAFKDDSITIPDGYRADLIKALLAASRPQKSNANAVTVTICKRGYTFNDPRRESQPSTKERRELFEFDVQADYRNIPISITGYQDRSFTLNVVVYCIRSEEALDKWRFETYAKLKQAYQKQMDDYNDQLRVAKQQSFFFGGSGANPDKNRNIEKEELKRACLSILTQQSFTLFDSINDPGDRIPTIKFDQVKAEGPYVQFFETAFEWTQLIYILYPYFWANPGKTWLRSLNLGLEDTKHEEFLKSGYARVVIPVRPEFNAAILKYLENGELWNGENADDIDLINPMYIQITNEIMERQGKLQGGSEIEDEWEYELPTGHQIITNGTNIPKPPFL